MKKNLVLSLSILFFIQLAAGQNQINYLPLNSCDPSADMDDLKSLDKYFTSTILVGMGESTHGTHEFFTMRHRVFKYLVLNHGFNTFFLEADYSNCLRADRYINGAEDDLHKVTLSLGLWPWETEEMADLISWMKEYNSGHDENKLSFIGCDMQQINTTIDEIDRIIMAYDSDLVDTSNYVNISQEAFYKINDWETLGRYKNIVKEKKALINKLDFRGNDKYIYQTLTRHLDQIVEEKYNPKFYSFRDVKMAENILYHLENNTEIKGFFWAHNLHVSNIYHLKKRNRNSILTAGGVLKKQLADKYFIIGQDFEKGSFNAYHRVNFIKRKKGEENINDFKLEAVSVGSNTRTIGNEFKDVKKTILFVRLSDISEKRIEKIYIHNIGAVYYAPRKKNKRTGLYLEHGVFDGIILVKDTKATALLE